MFLTSIQRLLRWYQRTFSPDHSPLRILFPYGVCRYEPTCSQYTIEAIQRYGWHGIIMGVKRLGRCYPWSKGGHDPVQL